MNKKINNNQKLKKVFASFLACSMLLPTLTMAIQAKEKNSISTMPTVKSYEIKEGAFKVTSQSRFYFVSETVPSAEVLETIQLVTSEMAAQGIGGNTPLDIAYGALTRIKSGDIVIQLGNVQKDGADGTQAYEMEITPENIFITVESSLGIKYAMNTLMQNKGIMQSGNIKDYPDVKERSLYIDCGRKYFTPESIKAVIKDMSWNKMNVLYLDFSNNNGFRFALDDMTMSWSNNSKTDDLSKMVSEKTLTQKDMDEILKLADLYGVQVIPTLNSPGHMDTILKAYPEYKKSNSTIDLENMEAKSFVQSLVKKYAEYFFSRGCTSFNISADEATGYDTNSQLYIDYVHELNAILKSIGFEVRMFNDGIEAGHADRIDKSIKVLFWDPSTDNASVLDLLQNGHDVVNFAADYMYYAHGNENAFRCSSDNIYDGTWNNELHAQQGEIENHNKGWNPGKFSKMAPKQQMSFMNGKFVYPSKGELPGSLIGASYAIWIDHHGNTVSDQVIFKNTYYKFRTMAERSWRVNTDSIKDPLYDTGKGYDIEQGVNSTYQQFFEQQLSVSKAPGGMFDTGEIDVENTILPKAKEAYMDIANKEALSKAIVYAESLDASIYVENTWNTMQAVLEEAKGVYANISATDSEVAMITKKLEDAVSKTLIIKKADYSKVNEALEKVNTLNRGEYKDFSKLDAAVKAVQFGYDITKQKEVDAMAQAIENEISKLEKMKQDNINQPELNGNRSPQTGDNTNLLLWLSSMVLALGAMGCMKLIASFKEHE